MLLIGRNRPQEERVRYTTWWMERTVQVRTTRPMAPAELARMLVMAAHESHWKHQHVEQAGKARPC
jgi:hypothetical protein